MLGGTMVSCKCNVIQTFFFFLNNDLLTLAPFSSNIESPLSDVTEIVLLKIIKHGSLTTF